MIYTRAQIYQFHLYNRKVIVKHTIVDTEGRLQFNLEHKSLATLQDGRFSASLGRCWVNIWRITTCLRILQKQKLQCEDYNWL